jgi:hypothetical protein
MASLIFNPGREEVCFALAVQNITVPATGARIHVGTASEFRPIAVHPTLNGSGTASGRTFASRMPIPGIIRNPETCYVNVHALPVYGSGVVRGQLG